MKSRSTKLPAVFLAVAAGCGSNAELFAAFVAGKFNSSGLLPVGGGSRSSRFP